MPTNKKESLIFGISMCLIMVFFMGLLNILVAGPISRAILRTIQSKHTQSATVLVKKNEN